MKEIMYREKPVDTEQEKTIYLEGIERLICQRQGEAEEERRKYTASIFEDQESFRRDLRTMLGWPLAEDGEKREIAVRKELLSQEEGFLIYRVSLEVMEGLWLSGLLFTVGESERRPMVIVQHGKLGTPELVSGFFGSTYNYHQLVSRVLQYDVHVFAPQLLLWDSGVYGVPYDRVDIDTRLKSVGSSIAAIEVYGLTRVIDYFEGTGYVTNIGMIGLSYGGFFTQLTAAVDIRVKAAISCSYFNERKRYRWSDWVWTDSMRKFQDAEIACLVYPRKLWIEVGCRDEAFSVEGARAEFKRLLELCSNQRQTWVQFIEFDGNHEFCMDDEPIRQLVEELL